MKTSTLIPKMSGQAKLSTIGPGKKPQRDLDEDEDPMVPEIEEEVEEEDNFDIPLDDDIDGFNEFDVDDDDDDF